MQGSPKNVVVDGVPGPWDDARGHGDGIREQRTAFSARVDAALDELGQGRRELDDLAGLGHGSVAVAAETLLLLAGLLAKFLGRHPGIGFRLYQSPAPAMAGLLHAGQVDFCLASQPLDDDSLEVAVPPAHRLAGRDRAGMDDLADEVFVVTRPGYWQRSLVDRLFAEAGRLIGCETDEPAAIPALIAAGLGVDLLPAASRRYSPRHAVAWLHLWQVHDGCVRR